MSTHLAAAIQAATTTEALRLAENLVGMATLVEYRLDLMAEFDVEALVNQSPLPAIYTCRPQREGGRYTGTEISRIAHLRVALAAGAYAVDLEEDILWHFRDIGHSSSLIIGSRHDFEGMLGDWGTISTEIRSQGADIAKLVGTAAGSGDVLTPFVWLLKERAPAIAIVMGGEGVASRILASRFDSAWLTFAAAATETAPGQMSIADACNRFRLEEVSSADHLFAWLTPPEVPWKKVEQLRHELDSFIRQNGISGTVALVPIPLQKLDARLLLALRLAGVRGVLRDHSVKCQDNLMYYGLPPDACCYRLDNNTMSSLANEAPEFQTCLHFWYQN